MVTCPSCGKELAEDADFCKWCGTRVGTASPSWFSEEYEEMVRDFSRDMERFGKEAAHRAEEFTRDLGSEIERMFRGRSICSKCGSSWPGVHDYCAKCGSRIG